MPKAFRWNRNCAQNFSWLRFHGPRTGERRAKVVSLMRIADELGYTTTRPLHRALAPAKWENDMDIRPPRKWRLLGGVLGVPGLLAEDWRHMPCSFRDRCEAITKPGPQPAWWRRLGAWLARLFGYNNRRGRPSVVGPMKGRDTP